MLQKRFQGVAPSMVAASISECGMDCSPGQEEQEVVGNLLPDCGHDDQRHGMVAVQQVVPFGKPTSRRP
jgi:hypothetical protein